ncbi:hypothetical protein [Agromyces italicus]|uniref:hypothetical protein n=1 Tax=Agromyces italicus TaxID=279572 RepID=UPI00040EF48B|nr:hypothetical protein [Agromyces italicus]
MNDPTRDDRMTTTARWLEAELARLDREYDGTVDELTDCERATLEALASRAKADGAVIATRAELAVATGCSVADIIAGEQWLRWRGSLNAKASRNNPRVMVYRLRGWERGA